MTPNDLQPILKGNLVTLRPIQSSDWEDLYKAASDPKIWAGHDKRNRYKEDAFRLYFDDAIASGSALAITHNKTGKIIGASRYHNYKTDEDEIEIGWTFLAREYWGGTYNAEIKRLMLSHAFNFLDNVIFWMATQNLRSRYAMEKIGGTLRDGDFSKTENGQKVPYVIFEIQKADFPSGSLKI